MTSSRANSDKLMLVFALRHAGECLVTPHPRPVRRETDEVDRRSPDIARCLLLRRRVQSGVMERERLGRILTLPNVVPSPRWRTVRVPLLRVQFNPATAGRVYVICPVCCWEDDGQDDEDAHEVRGGPNGSLSLTQARENYVRDSEHRTSGVLRGRGDPPRTSARTDTDRVSDVYLLVGRHLTPDLVDDRLRICIGPQLDHELLLVVGRQVGDVADALDLAVHDQAAELLDEDLETVQSGKPRTRMRGYSVATQPRSSRLRLPALERLCE